MPQGDQEQRRYLRHPIQVPLAVRPKDGPRFLSRVGDLSEGGVSFTAGGPLPVGTAIEVELPVHHSRFVLTGTVVACVELPAVGIWRVGLSFVEPEMSFKLKLAEQVLRIDELQLELAQERGAEVTRAEAAQVWVERYAETFADLYPKG
jgi:hypothetical protein